MSRAWILAAGVVALVTSSAGAATVDPSRTLTLQPSAIDTQPLEFVGRTGCSIVSVGVSLIKPGNEHADASPSTLIAAQAVSGCTVGLKLKPDQGCGAAGCRAGNDYQIDVQVQDAQGNQPIGSILLRVRQEGLRGPQ